MPGARRGMGCLIFLAVMAVLGVMGLLIGDPPSSRTPAEDSALAAERRLRDDLFNVRLECEQAIRNQLRAPSTAKFPHVAARDVRVGEGRRYIVVSYVDAQNAFGAQIRSNWYCEVRYRGDTLVIHDARIVSR